MRHVSSRPHEAADQWRLRLDFAPLCCLGVNPFGREYLKVGRHEMRHHLSWAAEYTFTRARSVTTGE